MRLSLIKIILSQTGPFALLLASPSLNAETAKNPLSWAGKYKGVSRNYLMTIEQLSQSHLSVEVRNLTTKPSLSSEPPISNFVATVAGDTAKFNELRDPQNCKVTLRRVPKGVLLDDYCGGTDGGLYIEQK